MTSRQPRRVAELFGRSTADDDVDWAAVVRDQECPFVQRTCFKTRKSDPALAIGTCTVRAGGAGTPVVICPNRFLATNDVFADAVPLLTDHRHGDDLWVIPEVAVPGGSVDYVLVCVRDRKPVDFVGIEFQALDTTGTVWPHRQEFLHAVGVPGAYDATDRRPFGVNWKMTAKTILVQLHHKIQTFQEVGKRLVLVLQTELMEYMQREFQFGHFVPATPTDSMHFHPYSLAEGPSAGLVLVPGERWSTDEAGLATALSLGASGRVDVDVLLAQLQRKLPDARPLDLDGGAVGPVWRGL